MKIAAAMTPMEMPAMVPVEGADFDSVLEEVDKDVGEVVGVLVGLVVDDELVDTELQVPKAIWQPLLARQKKSLLPQFPRTEQQPPNVLFKQTVPLLLGRTSRPSTRNRWLLLLVQKSS